MKKLLNRLRLHNLMPEPLIKVKISKQALIHNYRAYAEFCQMDVAPVLKSNAYGHGLVQIAEVLEKENVPFLVVDSFYEAKMLRRSLIKKPVLIIGYSTIEQIEMPLTDTVYTITSIEMLKNLASTLRSARKFHLKIDTGMRRQGILPDEIKLALRLIGKNSNIRIEGISSHFADADSEDDKFTLRQINVWNQAVKEIKSMLPNISYFHIAASAGSKYLKQIDSNVMRLGIGLYGLNPSPENGLDLRPVLQLVSQIASVKNLQARETIGYNNTYEAKKNMMVAIIPAGYYEGVDRRLSNKGSFKLAGKQCPIVGRVCMNISIIDISAISTAEIDEAIIISDNSNDTNCIENLAKICQTNPHELLVHIPAHLRREVF